MESIHQMKENVRLIIASLLLGHPARHYLQGKAYGCPDRTVSYSKFAFA